MDRSAIISVVKHLLKNKVLQSFKTSETICLAIQRYSTEDLISLLFMNLAFVVKGKITVAALSCFEALGSILI